MTDINSVLLLRTLSYVLTVEDEFTDEEILDAVEQVLGFEQTELAAAKVEAEINKAVDARELQ